MIYLKTSKLSTQYEYRLNTAGLDKSRPDQMLFVDLARGHWFTDKVCAQRFFTCVSSPDLLFIQGLICSL